MALVQAAAKPVCHTCSADISRTLGSMLGDVSAAKDIRQACAAAATRLPCVFPYGPCPRSSSPSHVMPGSVHTMKCGVSDAWLPTCHDCRQIAKAVYIYKIPVSLAGQASVVMYIYNKNIRLSPSSAAVCRNASILCRAKVTAFGPF